MTDRILTILVVDDDEQIQRAIRSILTTRQYRVLQATTGAAALNMIADASPDLVILDLMLPDTHGWDICREARQWYRGPILVLSARGHEHDKIKALDLGADDYLTKPFSTGELLARLRALLRRVREQKPAPTVLDVGDIHIDLLRRQVTRENTFITLTPIEYQVLVYLAMNVNCVVTSAMLVQYIWGENASQCDTQTLRSHISHLRRKIEPMPAAPQYLVTEPGVGFRLTVPDEEIPQILHTSP